MTTTVLSLADLVNTRFRWDDLLRHSIAFEARLFLSPEWVLTWWRHFGWGQPLFLVIAEKAQWLAMAPLFVAPSCLFPFARLVRFIGNGNADYGDFLVRRGCEGTAVAIWQWLFDHRDLWDVIALHELPQNSIAVQALRFMTLPDWMRVQVDDGEPCHRIPLFANESTNGQSWRERATKALQQQLRRRERQIARTFQARFGCVTDEGELPTMLAQLFALHRLRWGRLGQTGVFLSGRVRRFHAEFARLALRRGWLRLHWLTLNGVPAAIYYAFHCDGYAGFYTCGFHPAFSRYSVGKVLLAKVIDEAERDGAMMFDFMRGDESYKAEFSTIVTRNRHLFVWQADNLRSRAAARLHRLTTRLALWVKTCAQR
jgi:CelD/BcsL family acetyltransferase involved in cellulose biosynthesis